MKSPVLFILLVLATFALTAQKNPRVPSLIEDQIAAPLASPDFFSVQSLNAPTDIGNPPPVEWVKQFGGTGPAAAQDIVTDASGNSYVTGYFSGQVGFGGTTLTSNGAVDAFVAKYNNTGTTVWIRQISCSTYETAKGTGITLDAAGNVWATGYYNGNQLQIGTLTLPRTGTEDAFIVKFSASGVAQIATHYGQAGTIRKAGSLAITNGGIVVITCGGENTSTNGGNSLVAFQTNVTDIEYLDTYNNGALFFDVASFPGSDMIYVTGHIKSSVEFGGTTLNATATQQAPFLAKFTILSGFSNDWAVQGYISGTGTLYDRAFSLTLDNDGNIYFAGRFRKGLTFGEFTHSNPMYDYAPFIVKCNPSGVFQWINNAMVQYNSYYQTYNQPVMVAVDINGNPFIACSTVNDSLVFGEYQVGGPGWCIAKYLSDGTDFWAKAKNGVITALAGLPTEKSLYTGLQDGNAIVVQDNTMGVEEWRVTTSGHPGSAQVRDLKVDPDGHLYCWGRTEVTDPLFGNTTGSFLAKMRPDGTVIWSLPAQGAIIGLSNDGYGTSLTLDQENNVLVMGNFDDNITMGGLTLTNPGSSYVSFVAKVSPAGNVIWLLQVGDGSTFTQGFCIATDPMNNVIVSGIFSGLLKAGDFTLESAGEDDAFVAKFDRDGSLVWIKRAGGESEEYIGLVSTDASGNIFLTGEFLSRNITIGDFSLPLTESDGDVILAKFTPEGEVSWATDFGEDPSPGNLQRESCWPTAIKTTATGISYIYGWTGMHNYYGPYLLESPYNTGNFFLMKTDDQGLVQWADIIRERGQNWHSRQIDLDPEGNCYIGGNVKDSTWFDNNLVTPQGKYDLFTAKYGHDGAFKWVRIEGSNPMNLVESYTSMNLLNGIAVYDSASLFIGGVFSNDIQMDGTIISSSGSNGFIALLGAPIPDVPITRQISNTTLGNGDAACFNASRTITVAGNGTTFRVENGGDATLIAGENIIFLPGTTVISGGRLRGYITSTGDYCEPEKSLVAAAPATKEKALSFVSEINTWFVTIYPNPTTSTFTLEISDDYLSSRSDITIYNLMGETVLRDEMINTPARQISLGSGSDGIFILKVTNGEKCNTMKIIKIR